MNAIQQFLEGLEDFVNSATDQGDKLKMHVTLDNKDNRTSSLEKQVNHRIARYSSAINEKQVMDSVMVHVSPKAGICIQPMS